jgi:hypothetical protein
MPNGFWRTFGALLKKHPQHLPEFQTQKADNL